MKKFPQIPVTGKFITKDVFYIDNVGKRILC